LTPPTKKPQQIKMLGLSGGQTGDAVLAEAKALMAGE